MPSRPQTSYPRHWPIHVAGMQGAAVCQPTADPSDGGELTASPWLGLHYEAEGA
ncbi:hypothetical protein [Pseudarthrobacter albicanus]|uniref:hypothetical protein n=1 Tax=Pseudarthrobacter albicanus TaxID=2823873 RepID=UPI001BABB186|nr:hypothetical protein [Pseudarthrobacter albicanus]